MKSSNTTVARSGDSSGRKHYDKNIIREKTFELLSICLDGAGRDQGARLVWNCPACGKPEKYSVKKVERKGGCLVDGCRLAGYDDIFGMLAKIHGFDYYMDFRSVLAKSYDLLGLEPSENRSKSASERTAGGSPRRKQGEPRKTASEIRFRPDNASQPKNLADTTLLASEVYGRILEICPLETRERKYLRSRGLSLATIRRGRFGTMTVARARKVKAALQDEFGRSQILEVPGFSEDAESGRLKFTLTGDYLLIPYHDSQGRIRTIEGRCVGEPPEGMGKYVSLRRAGNHLYLFPGQRVEGIQAVCEGAMGAIVAAEFGLSVGAIQGCGRYRDSSSSETLDGKPDDPLPELKGVDFGGKTIPYIPDADDPPNPNVLRAAPKAARWIAEPQNGKAAICLLPRGVDLDEWLLSLNEEERKPRFAELLAGASPPEDGIELARPPKVESDQPELQSRSFGSGDPDAENNVSRKRKVSDGARRLRDRVYRAMLEALSIKEEHLRAFSKRGVWHATARAGMFASLDNSSSKSVVSKLTKDFGARRLLTVPGFELDEGGEVSIPLSESGEFVLIPCFDSEGLLSGVEALAFDLGTGELELEETVPFARGDEHLYIFAPYGVTQVEGFCEGILGALLAAQEDVVIGAIGHFRRHETSRGLGKEKQFTDAALPELAGVDFDGRTVVYVPRKGARLEDENSRHHESKKAAHQLIERQNGLPTIEVPNCDRADEEEGPTSLGEWILSLSEDEAQSRLRELFRIRAEDGKLQMDVAHTESEAQEDPPCPIPTGTAYALLLLSSITAAVFDAAILRLEDFAGYVSVGPEGEQVVYAGSLGPLRKSMDSPPLTFLYELHGTVALIFGLTVMVMLFVRTRRKELALLKVPQKHLAEHRDYSRAPDQRSGIFNDGVVKDALWGVVVWPVAFVFSICLIAAIRSLLDLATQFNFIAYPGLPDMEPTLGAACAATVVAVFVLWRRASIRHAGTKMLQGKIRH